MGNKILILTPMKITYWHLRSRLFHPHKKTGKQIHDRCFLRLAPHRTICSPIWYWEISYMRHRPTYYRDSCPHILMLFFAWQLRGDAKLDSDRLPAFKCGWSSSTGERKPSLEDGREGVREKMRAAWPNYKLEWTGLSVVCTLPYLSTHPVYLLLCLSPVSGQRVCMRLSDRKQARKEKMDRERKRPACVIFPNTQQSALIPYAQTTSHWFWQCLLSPPLILRGLNQACLCRQVIPKCTSIWTVNIAQSWLGFSAVQIRFCTARLQIKIIWKTWPQMLSRKCLHISNNSFNPWRRASKGGDSDLHGFSCTSKSTAEELYGKLSRHNYCCDLKQDTVFTQ